MKSSILTILGLFSLPLIGTFGSSSRSKIPYFMINLERFPEERRNYAIVVESSSNSHNLLFMSERGEVAESEMKDLLKKYQDLVNVTFEDPIFGYKISFRAEREEDIYGDYILLKMRLEIRNMIGSDSFYYSKIWEEYYNKSRELSQMIFDKMMSGELPDGVLRSFDRKELYIDRLLEDVKFSKNVVRKALFLFGECLIMTKGEYKMGFVERRIDSGGWIDGLGDNHISLKIVPTPSLSSVKSHKLRLI